MCYIRLCDRCGSSELKNNCRRVRHKVTKPITGDWTWKPWLIEAGRAPVPARNASRRLYVEEKPCSLLAYLSLQIAGAGKRP